MAMNVNSRSPLKHSASHAARFFHGAQYRGQYRELVASRRSLLNPVLPFVRFRTAVLTAFVLALVLAAGSAAMIGKAPLTSPPSDVSRL